MKGFENIEHSIILDRIATFISTVFIYISLEDADHFVHMLAGIMMATFWGIRIYEKFSGNLISDVWRRWRDDRRLRKSQKIASKSRKIEEVNSSEEEHF